MYYTVTKLTTRDSTTPCISSLAMINKYDWLFGFEETLIYVVIGLICKYLQSNQPGKNKIKIKPVLKT